MKDEDLFSKSRRDSKKKRSEYSEHLKAKYQAIRERALAAAFGHLSDKDWKKLDKSWKRFAKP